MPSNTPIFSPYQCVRCGNISGGFNTVQQLKKTDCEALGMISSVGAEQYQNNPNTLGGCGQALSASSCNEYFAFRSVQGVPVQVITPWISLGGAGNVCVNACNASEAVDCTTQETYSGSIPIYYDSLQSLTSSCQSFANLHPELNLCLRRVDQYSPISIPNTNTTIDNTVPNTITYTAGSSGGLPPPVTVTGASAAANEILEKLNELDKLKNGMNGGNLNQVPTGLLDAILNFLRMNGLSTFMVMPILPEIPALGGGQTASTGTLIIIAYNDNETESSTFSITIPLT